MRCVWGTRSLGFSPMRWLWTIADVCGLSSKREVGFDCCY